VPEKLVTQRKCVGHLVDRHLVIAYHLRLDLAVGIGGEQRVVNHVTVVADDVGGSPDWIQDFQVRIHHGTQRLLSVCGGSESQRSGSEQDSKGTSEMITHRPLPYKKWPRRRRIF
jgi:hypothetical protein